MAQVARRFRRLIHQLEAPPPRTITPAAAAISTTACGLSLPVGTGGSAHCFEFLFAVALLPGTCQVSAEPGDSTFTTFWCRPGANVVGWPRSLGLGVKLLSLPMGRSMVVVLVAEDGDVAVGVAVEDDALEHGVDVRLRSGAGARRPWP